MKENLLFYHAYQDFYQMANESEVFQAYCKRAFGEDFSQDGFSDVNQLNKILALVDLNTNSCVLDIGCGNGKMLEYIHHKTGAEIYGFDYSENAIEAAVQRTGLQQNFKVAVMGEIQYPESKFDLITSMDTIYFAPDIPAFVAQLYRWLKPRGAFICGYQEGDVMKKTSNQDTTALAKALKQHGIPYTVIDYTRETYEMLRHKREVILSMKNDFKHADISLWYKVIKHQTDSILVCYEAYRKKNARYIYVIKNNS